MIHLGAASSGGAGWYDPGYGGSGGSYAYDSAYGGGSYAHHHDAGYGGAYGHDTAGYGGHGRVVATRVTTYEEPVHVSREVHRVLLKKKRRKQVHVAVVPAEPVAVVPAHGILAQPERFEGSYVAVSGTPGRGSVHVVESGRGRS